MQGNQPAADGGEVAERLREDLIVNKEVKHEILS